MDSLEEENMDRVVRIPLLRLDGQKEAHGEDHEVTLAKRLKNGARGHEDWNSDDLVA